MINKSFLIASIITSLVFGITSGSNAIDITPTGDAETLVNQILGPGVTLVPSSATYTGLPVAAGTFTNGVSSGILPGKD